MLVNLAFYTTIITTIITITTITIITTIIIITTQETNPSIRPMVLNLPPLHLPWTTYNNLPLLDMDAWNQCPTT